MLPDWLFIMLWVLDDDLIIRELIEKRQNDSGENPIWLDIIYGATLLRERAAAGKVDKIIGHMQKRLEVEVGHEAKVLMMIGLAYLNFIYGKTII